LDSPVAVFFGDAGVLAAQRVGLGGVKNPTAESDAEDAEQQGEPDDGSFSRIRPEISIFFHERRTMQEPQRRIDCSEVGFDQIIGELATW
jgi:hypothetical protein